jgi:hypothetical protein
MEGGKNCFTFPQEKLTYANSQTLLLSARAHGVYYRIKREEVEPTAYFIDCSRLAAGGQFIPNLVKKNKDPNGAIGEKQRRRRRRALFYQHYHYLPGVQG